MDLVRVIPYLFEPEYSQSEINNRQEEQESQLPLNLNVDELKSNCLCNNCVPACLSLGLEEDELKRFLTHNDVEAGLICCQTIRNAKRAMREHIVHTGHEISCIVEHEDFQTVCLNRGVLRTNYRGYYYQRRRGAPPRELLNRTYRYTSYRNFSHMIHHHMGRRNRRKIPLCAMLQIRREFPEENNSDYAGYQAAWNFI